VTRDDTTTTTTTNNNNNNNNNNKAVLLYKLFRLQEVKDLILFMIYSLHSNQKSFYLDRSHSNSFRFMLHCVLIGMNRRVVSPFKAQTNLHCIEIKDSARGA
jgi:hypothetical protein